MQNHVLLQTKFIGNIGKDARGEYYPGCNDYSNAQVSPSSGVLNCDIERPTCRNRQFRPRISYLSYPVISQNPSDANTMGQSGMLGSLMTKFCWTRSTVVARSSATLGNVLAAVIFLDAASGLLCCSAVCKRVLVTSQGREHGAALRDAELITASH